MASEVSTIQSLRAVDAWIDVINANINGGVRTAFKASRLKFSGSNVDVSRSGTSTSLPLQFPEPGLTTANTVIDFSQGAITASTENTHLAIQGEGFFLLAAPQLVAADGTLKQPTVAAGGEFLLTRDGEFRTNQQGLLVNAAGYYLITAQFEPAGATADWLAYSGGVTWGVNSQMRAVYNNLDSPAPNPAMTGAIRLSDFLTNTIVPGVTPLADGVTTLTVFGGSPPCSAIVKATLGKQNLQFSRQGATVFDFGADIVTLVNGGHDYDPAISLAVATTSDATILNKSLEASNASMTQSVPELSLAQKLFSALTKVLQTKQTNVDGVLNLVR